MAGYTGPKDIFTNKEALFRIFEPQEEEQSPFDLHLTKQGSDFAVMNMHFKLGLYDYNSAGAIQAVMDLLATDSQNILAGGDYSSLSNIKIKAY
jgi:2-methylcitrate dehydratase